MSSSPGHEMNLSDGVPLTPLQPLEPRTNGVLILEHKTTMPKDKQSGFLIYLSTRLHNGALVLLSTKDSSCYARETVARPAMDVEKYLSQCM